jgi:hypothetical protein
MAVAPWAEDRQKLEAIVIKATRTKAARDLDLARRALARFREKWPEGAGGVAAFAHALDALKATA